MQLIPEWMNNVHPLIVHLPIALLVIAVVADFLGLVLKRFTWIKPAALWLYVFGALGTVAAYFSGKEAAESVSFPAPAYPVVSIHADLALYTMLFFSIYALIRLFLAWKKYDQKTAISIVLFAVAAGGLGLVQQTAERGGELVFRYGVGTKAQLAPVKAATPVEADRAAITVSENGSWHWLADAKAELTFRNNFRLLQGNWAKLSLQTVNFNGQNKALRIQIQNKNPFVFTFGPKLQNVQIIARINPEAFRGRVLLVHHFNSPQRYDFLSVENGTIRLGRVEEGKSIIFNTATINQSGWLTLKVVSSGGHYRGYVNDQLLVHGHSSDLPAGTNGLALQGSGALLIEKIETRNLNETMNEAMGGASGHSGMSNQH